MFKQNLIKICGIKNPYIALAAAKIGADFIGIVLHPDSKRFVSLSQAKMINAAAKNGGAKGVGIFVNHSASVMLDICKFAGIKTVQLHGTLAKQEAYRLPQSIQRIYVVNIDPDGSVLDTCDRENIKHLNPKRDFLLFDRAEAGGGKSFNLSKFKCIYDFPFFLAGGLNVSNVVQAISIVQPMGVDISSGVEKYPGKKDLRLIQQLIKQIKTMEENNG